MENDIIEMLNLEEQLKDLKNDYEEARKKAIDLINRLDDELLKDVLFLRYIAFMKWEEIAEILNYSERNIYYLYKKAIKEAKNIQV